MADAAYWQGDANLNWAGDDNSNPNASASSSLSSAYRGGDYYTVSGRSNTGVGLGKIVIYGLVGLGFIGCLRKSGVNNGLGIF